MKTIITLIFLAASTSIFSQWPIVENFNPGNPWTFTNGSGIQNYGQPENYATTNVGTTAYPNNANVYLTSPTHDLTECNSGIITISFLLQGRIENNEDFLYFQYRIGSGAWTTVTSFTGPQNAVQSYTSIPSSATQFRFWLDTDPTVNSYTTGPWWSPTINVYYYDIAYFRIACSIPLGIDQLVFNGGRKGSSNYLNWIGINQNNVDRYILEHSTDGYDWSLITSVNASEAGSHSFTHTEPEKTVNYYRISVIDYDGTLHVFDQQVVAIDNTQPTHQEIVACYNILGQPVALTESGVVIIEYADGTITKTLNP